MSEAGRASGVSTEELEPGDAGVASGSTGRTGVADGQHGAEGCDLVSRTDVWISAWADPAAIARAVKAVRTYPA